MILRRLEPVEQKELVRLFIQRVEVRRSSPARRASGTREESTETAARVRALKIKLRLPQLVQGVEIREELNAPLPRHRPLVAARGLDFSVQVDFTHASAGEVTIVAPFRHAVGSSARVRTPKPKEPPVEHAIVRARKWQQQLANGRISIRVALAKREGITPGAVTRILKLVELLPEIQDFLAALKTKDAIRNFPIKEVGAMASLPMGSQREAFDGLRRSLSP